MAYATLRQLQAGWRALTPEEEVVAETLLERASRKIDHRAKWDVCPAEVLDIAGDVCCDMVRRAMQGNAGAGGYVGDMSLMDSFESMTPVGDLYILDGELSALGVRAQRISSVAVC